jgi:hypothetical protein
MGYSRDLALPFPAAVKTGTTTDFRDNWVMGYTPAIVVGVWMGNTDGHPMIESSGLQTAAPLWRTVMEVIYGNPLTRASLYVGNTPPPTEFARPAGIEERAVCLPGGTGGSACAASRMDLFLSGGPVHGISRLGYVPDTVSNPGAWTLRVAPLPAEAAHLVVLAPLSDGYQPPLPSHCVLNSSRADGVTTRLMLPVPPYYPDELRARLWAGQHGYTMAPPIACPVAVAARLTAADAPAAPGQPGGGADPAEGAPPPANADWRISAPAAGQAVSGLVSVVGTANFDPSQVQYYKLEIGSGRQPSQWITFGSTHHQPVVNGLLEELHAYALAPGDYVIRLVLVANDGNYPAPYAVPITITSSGG